MLLHILFERIGLLLTCAIILVSVGPVLTSDEQSEPLRLVPGWMLRNEVFYTSMSLSGASVTCTFNHTRCPIGVVLGLQLQVLIHLVLDSLVGSSSESSNTTPRAWTASWTVLVPLECWTCVYIVFPLHSCLTYTTSIASKPQPVNLSFRYLTVPVITRVVVHLFFSSCRSITNYNT